ncbi:hypothetical protein DPX39_100069400 [Trypanosoma brucei equiperdum]|uniref:Uncharacterized protein n=1 Tax=Trypanosoma brucei equiperdum TaxID=630700 RepID=A0A3L6L2U2_9TRYP|nr:hypothetical protein DPX39_100069400 [Trypanosoma brucei equiperdum]
MSSETVAIQTLLEAFEESSERINALYNKVKSAGDDCKERATTIDVFRVLHDCFVFHTDTLQNQIDALKTYEEQEAENIEEEVEELEKELHLLDRISRGCDDAGCPLPSVNDVSLAAYQAFVTRSVDLSAQLSVMLEGLRHILTLTPPRLSKAQSIVTWLGVANKATWSAKEKQLNASWKSLEEDARLASASVDEPSLVAVRQLLSDVMQLGKKAVSAVGSGSRAETERARDVEHLGSQQRRLVLWCRQQQANLDVLTEPDHIQEFCKSLLEHYNVMSDNYHVVLEKAEPYMDNETVQEWLLEASEAWLHLQVKALEQFRRTLFEVHQDSLLEDQVEGQSAFCLQLGTVLGALECTLTPWCEVRSSACGRCIQLLDSCRELRGMMPEYEKLSRQLLELTDRLRIDREAYDCYRAAALSHVTYLSSSAELLAEAARRKGEYKACVYELQEWAVKKVRCDSWRNIRDKVRDIKDLLEQDQLLQRHRGEPV